MTNLRKSKPKRRKPRRRKQVVPSQPNDIPYSKYRIEWTDALSDSGWADDREFTKMKLAKPINEGWVFSKDKTQLKYLRLTIKIQIQMKLLLGIGQ